MLSNLALAYNTISSCFFFFFLNINLYFLIHAGNLQHFNQIAELVILIRMPNKTAKTETETSF